VHYEPQPDYFPMPDDLPQVPDQVKKATQGIGKVLRRIFHF
jgi:hypothetical protein